MPDYVANRYLDCRVNKGVRRTRASQSTKSIVENRGACAISSQKTLWQITQQAKTVLFEDDDKLACAIYSVFSERFLPIERVDDVGLLRRLRHGAGL